MNYFRRYLLMIPIIFYYSNVVALNIFNFEDSDSEIWKHDKNQYIRYEDFNFDEHGLNDHPIVLDANVVKVGISSLKWMDDLSDNFFNSKTIFDEGHISILSQFLVEGLKKSSARKDIIFSFEKVKERFYGLKKSSYFISGRAFYKNGKLNIILGEYEKPRNIGYEAAYDPSNVGIVGYHLSHGSREIGRSEALWSEKKLFLVDGLSQGGINNDHFGWISIDLDKVIKSVAYLKDTERKKELLKNRKEIEEVMSLSNYKHNNTVGGVEERLVVLNSLREKNLISEDEYLSKRKEILGDL
ncbi:hypothetical protein [Porticoccus sp.]|uniref:hypothetical protein n=2 Tax=Porticoccus TaxID=1123967 RepID=UPI0025DCD8E2|nr:hypothetical protein [Porticoccus sp.]|tara:strand:+ start:8069 stop:8965 length:897 start_codon:yes stop_codon:yes gene_type:complete